MCGWECSDAPALDYEASSFTLYYYVFVRCNVDAHIGWLQERGYEEYCISNSESLALHAFFISCAFARNCKSNVFFSSSLDCLIAFRRSSRSFYTLSLQYTAYTHLFKEFREFVAFLQRLLN